MSSGRRVLTLLVAFGLTACTGAASEPEAGFARRVIASGLGNPYELVTGPDGWIWATEKSGKRVIRVDPASGAVAVALELPEAVASPNGQDGVLGLALDPRGHVYLSHTYGDRRLKIARYDYDAPSGTLRNPVDVLADLPGGVDHQSARLRFGPDGRLYYAIGDQGANQFERKCRPVESQRLPTSAEVAARDWSAYQGKTLRLEPDGGIPADNPVLDGVRSHVLSYGHRNGQGLDFAPDGRLFQAEQGPKTDDEVNIIRPGGNYGWPHVAGYRDDKAYTYANWSASSPTPCAELEFDNTDVPPSVPQQAETAWRGELVEPIRTFHTVESDHDFTDPKCGDVRFICWPTLAISSLSHYDSDGIPGWRGSLVTTNLKDGSLHRMTVTGDGIGRVDTLFKDRARYRDTAFSADGKSVYVAADLEGLVRDADGAPTSDLAVRGAIVEFRWTG